MGLFDNNAKVAGTPAGNAQASAKTEEKVELTKGQEKAKRYRDALERIVKYISDNKDKVGESLYKDAMIVRPSFFGITNGGGFQKSEFSGAQNKLLKLLGKTKFEELAVGDSFTELTAFQKLYAGRKEMHAVTVDLIKEPRDHKAVYLEFDATKGTYTIKGIGAVPAGWTGYLPAKKDGE